MNVSVVIPAYNSSRTIRATLESVLQQTEPPDEILILDDGSTENTVSILNSYKPRVTILHLKHGGVASARNELCARASGELIAFLDHDDIWHPKYLEVQRNSFKKYPHAVAFFAGHVDSFGYANYQWGGSPPRSNADIELIDPVSFLTQYNTISGLFGSASFFCVPKWVLTEIGKAPFGEMVSGVDDGYLCGLLPLLGPVVYASAPLVAYRIIKEAQSTDKVKAFGLWVRVFELLEERYRGQAPPDLLKAFQAAFASKRRQYAKRLMGAGRTAEARRQIRISLSNSSSLESITKSLGILVFSYMPRPLQVKWPPSNREWKEQKNT